MEGLFAGIIIISPKRYWTEATNKYRVDTILHSYELLKH